MISEERAEPMSGVVRAIHQTDIVSFETGDDHLAEIEFDHANKGQSTDLRPLVPLSFRW